MQTLPTPEVMRLSVEKEHHTSMTALWLRWNGAGQERLWYLPKDVCLTGPAPERFGVTIQRRGLDDYAVRLMWNEMCLSWSSLQRVHLVSSALTPLLRALGQDLLKLLDQPLQKEAAFPAA